MHSIYPKTPQPTFDDLHLKINDLVSCEIKEDSSPGAPLMAISPINRDLIAMTGDMVNNLVYNRINSIIALKQLPTLREAIESGLTDPIRIFIKQEPHKISKIKEGRLRLISSVSLIDQVIDRFIYTAQNEAEINCWKDIPTKCGTGLSLDSQQQELYSNIKKISRKLFSSDVKGWDWNYKEWQHKVEAIRRMMAWGYSFDYSYCAAFNLVNYNALPSIVKLLIFRTKFLSYNLLMLSDGTIVTHGKPGWQKSGSYITLSANSSQRTILPIIIADSSPAVMGDDCVEDACDRSLEEITNGYTKFGFNITDGKFIEGDEPIEFCSHLLYKDRAIPQNQVKMAFKYLHSNLRDTLEQQDQIINDLRYAPDGKLFIKIFSSVIEGWANNNETE